jgi:hypothetical protein
VEPLNEEIIRKSFVNCSKGEARRLSLPAGLADIEWPECEFLGWRDPKATNNAYIVMPWGADILGLALRVANPPTSRAKQSACALCYSVHGSADVGLFSARRVGTAGKLGNTVGTYICGDLGCSRHIRVPQPVKTAALDERIARMRSNLNRFVDEVLTDNA